MTVQETITQKLADKLHPGHLEVINESNNHNVPAGSESHFKLIIVSDEFNNKPLIARHRTINSLLAEELKNQIHALAIHAYSEQEWSDQNGLAPKSPPCLGGSN